MDIPWGTTPALMGVLNATGDSFSGDGLGSDLDAIVARGRLQIDGGASILDLGAQSSHPQAASIGVAAELAARHGAWLVVTDNGWSRPPRPDRRAARVTPAGARTPRPGPAR